MMAVVKKPEEVIDMYALPLDPCAETEMNLRGFFAYGKALLCLWINKARQRQHLAQLDTHLLKDIGVTPEQARHEAEKRFWE